MPQDLETPAYNCGLEGCEYVTPPDSEDPRNALEGHLKGKMATDDAHREAWESDAAAKWHPELYDQAERADPEGAPGGSDDELADDLDDPDGALHGEGKPLNVADDQGATDEEVRVAVEAAEAEDAGEYEQQWKHATTDGGQRAETEVVDEGRDLPVGWLAVGVTVALVVLVLVVLYAGDDEPETVESFEQEEQPTEVPAIQAEEGAL